MKVWVKARIEWFEISIVSKLVTKIYWLVRNYKLARWGHDHQQSKINHHCHCYHHDFKRNVMHTYICVCMQNVNCYPATGCCLLVECATWWNVTHTHTWRFERLWSERTGNGRSLSNQSELIDFFLQIEQISNTKLKKVGFAKFFLQPQVGVLYFFRSNSYAILQVTQECHVHLRYQMW